MTRGILLVALVAKVAIAQQAKAPAEVAVVANEYAFVGFPTTIAPGPTFFSFENRGQVKHEMSIVLLKPGVTMKDAVTAGSASGPKIAESLIGLLIARKHEAAGGKLFVELKSGQHYLVICNLKDNPEAEPHAKLGMVTSFDVP
jgi:hypothetical protein